MSAIQVPTASKIRELKRELGLRKKFYPERVARGALSENDMRYRLEVLEAILADYEQKERGERRL